MGGWHGQPKVARATHRADHSLAPLAHGTWIGAATAADSACYCTLGGHENVTPNVLTFGVSFV